MSGTDAAADDLASILDWLAVFPDGGPAEQEAIAGLAEELTTLEPGIITPFTDPRLAPEGLLPVLEGVGADVLPTVVAALVALSNDRAALLQLCTVAIQRGGARAQTAADILAPGNLLSTLLVAFGTSGPSLACLEAIETGLSRPGSSLAEACSAVVVPSEITRILACLHGATLPFGEESALALVEGHFFDRLLAPVVGNAPAMPPDVQGAFTKQLIAAGRHAERLAQEGDDPDDPVIQRAEALETLEALHHAFQVPTPADPLGTEPAIGVTALGQAIRRARSVRPGGYDWGAVLALEAADPEAYGMLVTDERLIVLDLAAPIAGIAISDRP